MAPAPKYDQQTQQKMILQAAEQCINESSVTDFTMAKIARVAGLSMGSVYKFVQSKEDIVLALAYQSFVHVSKIFDQVLALPISTPEKILAISLIAPQRLQCFEFDYELQTYATNEAVIRKGSSYWTSKIIEASSRCESAFKLALTDGINSGELKDVPNLGEVIEEIIISGWAMTVGYEQVQRVQQTKQIVEGTDSLQQPLELEHPIIRSSVRLLNSYPWQAPLTNDSLINIEQQLTALNLR
ncbi:TetR/AcrR family transcriptional regulator [Pseudoalteromonas sp. SMS1]|uniref:TetR/AcrR family transcriptional regulator n=1 Tax=Pseudoalteromonas sp. SMS1 TaxID=2908894 RepID=UPI001F22EA80|nr:TetR/AcrR family transcriptional regulator [Pseudoalteromonas sp. SMS1]MCF2858411.1 TetR/AcrR family transcriptional regulator [Pseudoalteromonas sp. SMS1]